MKKGMRFAMLLMVSIILFTSSVFAFDICLGNAETPEEIICQNDVFNGVTASCVKFYDCSDDVIAAQQTECLLCEAGLTDPTSQLCIGLLNTFVLPGCTAPNANHQCNNCDYDMDDCVDAAPIVAIINNALGDECEVPEFSPVWTGVLLVVLVVFLLVLNKRK